MKRNVIAILLLMMAFNANAEVTLKRFQAMCSYPNDFCRGFLLGVFEGQSVHEGNIDKRAKRYEKLPWLTGFVTACFPKQYEPIMYRSIADFLDAVRSDIYPAIMNRASKYQDNRVPINSPTLGENFLLDVISETYSCDLPNRLGGVPTW